MCKTFPERVKTRILPLSESGNIRLAIEEWQFTDRVHDNGHAVENCDFCGHESIRYQFEIENTHNGNRIWVGSSCILRFEIPVLYQGKRLDTTAAKKRMENLAFEVRRQSCISALEKLAHNESSDALHNALVQYKRRRTLTPRQTALIFWRLNVNQIDHCPSFFTVDLRKNRYKDDLKEMPRWKVHQIWPALSSSQRKIAQRLGHTPPPTKKNTSVVSKQI